ncbi:beta-ketoacyl synthase N-terminal-like domain-containing protein [Streptomyces sp. NPDC018045]|uniref:type I polyketide synthase n=1 Tax=Streptomyces sp. NPDC018045 TaxID=3365037 RepID=UPI00379D69F0
MSGERDIAVVGMAGRFPGARNLREFWAQVRDGVEAVSFFTEEQVLAAGATPEDVARPNFVRAGSRMADLELFDAEFFGYTPREAELMDPQHRVFLETAWEALEHSGYGPEHVTGDIGVFAGAGTNNYLANIHTHPEVVESAGGTQVLLGNELGFLATRVAYKLDLRGPAVSLRTACSTSLVAVHLACRALRARECDMALSGGVFVNLDQERGYLHQEGSFLSPDGHCRPFDARAAGTVFGSGAGAVVLKRLDDALAAGDTVYAVIKGSAVNNDGAVKAGFTAPTVAGQARVIGAALRDGGVPAGSVGYVEAHGTGTALGDPVELRALATAYEGVAPGSVALGSLKGNIGHLDAAAGIAGLIKTVLALWHETLPPTVNFSSRNPDIDFTGGPFAVQREAAAWPRSAAPRRAGVSAFGFGGTNAHVVLQEAPAAAPGDARGRSSQVLLLSARSPEALEELSERTAARLRAGDVSFADAAYTSAVGRNRFPYRRVVTGPDGTAAAAALEARDPARVATAHCAGGSPGVAFLLSGQGGQYPGMARELYAEEPVFRRAVDRCAGVLAAGGTGVDVVGLMFGDGDDPEAVAALQRTEAAQPALFVVEYALAQLWESWGITPAALLGHSLGELVAACLAGVFAVEDALRLVALRGKLMQAQRTGSMVSVVADRATVVPLLPDGVALAAHNGPKDCVVSGPADAVAAFAERLAARGVVTQPVATSHAFHSALMRPMAAEFTAAVAAVPRQAPGVRFVSNVTGTWITDEQAQDPEYWGRHVLAPVEFVAGVDTLAADPDLVLLEVGPGQTLSSLARRIVTGGASHLITSSLPHRRDARHPAEAVRRALGQLWLAGREPDWAGVYGNERRRRVALPSYPFQRQRYWLERGTGGLPAARPSTRRTDLADWFQVPSWERAPLPPAPRDRSGERWLVFTDATGLGTALAARLRRDGAETATVAAGSGWVQEEDGRFTIGPGDADHYARLLRTAGGDGRPPTHIAHCWTVTEASAAHRSAADTGVLRLGFESLLLLTQAFNGLPDRPGCRIWAVGNGLHDVTGTEPLMPLKATVLGPCRVTPREHPALACRSVDVLLDGPPSERLVDQLVREFAVPPEHADVAYRGAHRWVRTYPPAPLPAPAAGASVLRADGVYLITGGTGGLGLALAAHLARPGRKLALVARTPVPPRREWDRWLGRPAGDRTGDVVRALHGMVEQGAEVLTVQANVCDRTRTAEAVGEVLARWGRVDGVFHAAGLAGGGLIQLKTPDEAAAVLGPKVAGTLNLERALRGQRLDFLALFGSNAANVGDFGLVDYVAANSFLDAYAHARTGPDAPAHRVVTVDWGPWRDVGMAAATDLGDALADARGKDLAERGMAPADALLALERALSSSEEPQLIVTPVDARTLIDSAFTLTAGAPESDERVAGLGAPRPVHPRPEVASAYAAPRSATERQLCAAWQELLGIDRVGVDDSFFDLGGSSLVAIQLVATVNKALGATLTVARLYEALTVARLAALVDGAAAAPAEDTRQSLDEVKSRASSRRQHQQSRMARSRARRQP